MTSFLALTVVGLGLGCIYALTASGLVVTYTTSGVFNFAHGTIGAVAAFVYWQLAVVWHIPQWISAVVVVAVASPLIGVVLERTLMRPLRGAPDEVCMVVTIGLMLALLGLITTIWPPTESHRIPPLFSGHSVKVSGVVVTYHELIMVGTVVLIAVLLRAFLYGTSTGVALRGLVDNPTLLGLTGSSPSRLARLGWAIGSMLAGLAGVLLSGLVSLTAETLTLLVVSGYAAAMLGRLRNLPLTFTGGLLLGLTVAYALGYLPAGDFVSRLQPVVPVVFLMVVLLLLPRYKPRRALAAHDLRLLRVPSARRSVVTACMSVLAAAILAAVLSGSNVLTLGHGLAVGLILLSLVPLSGYAGQVSLCQLTLAGLGAVVMAKVGDGASPLGLLLAVALAAVAGIVVAVPALRLSGLYLALLTLGVAQAADVVFFGDDRVFGRGGSLYLGRFDIFSLSLQGDRANLVFTAAVLAVTSLGVLAFRRSAWGRRAVALADSPLAVSSLGINLVRTKVIVFAMSSAIAGLGGALYGMQQGQVGTADFNFLVGLALLLLAFLGGLRSIAGIIAIGIVFAIFPVIQAYVPAIHDLAFLLTGLAAVSLGRSVGGAARHGLPTRARRSRPKDRAAAVSDEGGVIADVPADR